MSQVFKVFFRFVFVLLRLAHPEGWICVHCKSLLVLLLLTFSCLCQPAWFAYPTMERSFKKKERIQGLDKIGSITVSHQSMDFRWIMPTKAPRLNTGTSIQLFSSEYFRSRVILLNLTRIYFESVPLFSQISPGIWVIIPEFSFCTQLEMEICYLDVFFHMQAFHCLSLMK